MTARIELRPAFFGETERPFLVAGDFRVSTFRYASGVEALRVANRRGEIVVLPFRGQQIWRAGFDGRELTMKSMFDEPVDTRVYLETYGAFLIHCGITAMGVPGPDDRHPLHGELPNAPFRDAWLELDPDGGRLAIGGSYRHTVAFQTDYRATARIALGADAAMLDVSLGVENLKRSPMELMYLAHANFRPVDGGELIYSAPYTPEAVRVRRSIPAHISPKPGYREFLDALASDPLLHHHLAPGLAFDPEVAFQIDMRAGPDGRAIALQRHPDGTADCIRYRPDQAGHCIRWICRTPDQDAIGMAFPATAGVEGYLAERAAGRILSVPAGSSWRIDMSMGLLTPAETAATVGTIDRIRGA
jgi:hypothetical protein